MWGGDKKEGLGLESALWSHDWGMHGLVEDKGCFAGLLVDPFLQTPVSGAKSVVLCLVQEGILLEVNLCPAFRQKGGGQRALLHLLFLQIINKPKWCILV